MTALSGIILCFLPFLGIRSAYTKSYRAVHFGIKGEGITKYPSLDLVTRELPQALEKLCTEHLCLSKELEEIVYDWVDNHSCTILKTSHVYLLRGTQAPQYPTSDKSVTTNRDAEFQEIHNLFKGNLVCRTSCDPSSLVYRRDCKFAKLISEFRIYPPVPFAMLTFEQWSYLFEFGDALFNLQLYIHAEAWCYYLVHNLLYFDRTGKDDRELTFDTESPVVGFSTLTISQHRLLIRGSLLLSEVAKLKGQLEVATHHSLRVIRSHNLLAADFNKTLPNFAVLSRLRILLTIPPTPPTYVDAVKYRQEMIQDMRTFQQSIVDSNIRLSLEDLSTHISAMPFNMAHQGLNDLEIQTAIYQVLSALCPELASPTTTLSSARTALNNAHMLAESVAIASNPLHNLQCQLFFGNGSGRPTSCVHKVLKVGFISTNFFDHSIGRILVELLVYLNQQRVVQRGEVNYALKIYVITLDRRIPFDTKVHYNGTHLEFEDLDVSTMREDAITRILRQQMKENYIRIPENIHTARKVLEAMQLDMLIFTDVGMDFSTYQLAFSRHAPIQAAWWGHPITTALPSMDYFISLDDEVPIAAHSHYSEQLVRMQHINTVPLAEPFTSRLKRLQLNISAVAPASSSAHEDQHSDENVFKAHQEAENDRKALSALNFSVDDDIILVLGRLFKVHPEFDDIIADLLLQIVELTAAPATSTTSEDVDADSATSTYIVFIAESLDALNVLVYERMLAALQLKLRSTAPTFSPSETTQEDSRAHKLFHRYVRFIGYDHYYTLLRSARVVLDTYPYGGCLTSHDALSHAVPMVTLPSEYIRGRFSLSLYREMSITSLVAATNADFVNITMRLLTNDNLWREQAELVQSGFKRVIPTNNWKVAKEWSEFIVSALM